MHDKIDKKKYGKLLAEVLPRRIETEEENEYYLEIVEQMMKKGAEKFSPEESKLFDLLVTLIEEFEEEAYPMGNASPHNVLLHLMEARDLKQADLLDVFGSKGIASEVVNGKRAISKTHAKRLAEKFKVSVELFI
jgi:HTH-type transcriptional regulator/antitoxin HigA